MWDPVSDAFTAFGITAVSELGDKSQFLLAALAARRPRLPVAIGGLLGIAGVQLVSVLVGGWLAASAVTRALPVFAGVLFIIFGAMTLRAEDDEALNGDDVGVGLETSKRSAVVTSAGLLFVAELGDKTMFTTAALAAVRTPWAVLVGAMLAFAVLTTLAVLVGAAFAERLPARSLRTLSGSVLLTVGVLILLTEIR